MKIETLLVHAGEPQPRIGRAVAMPVFQSSTFVEVGDTGYHDVMYARLSNTPNHDALHAKLAALEGAEAAIVTSSVFERSKRMSAPTRLLQPVTSSAAMRSLA
jgi:cystathionine beta-lyase/cystathionine gamma-synthase